MTSSPSLRFGERDVRAILHVPEGGEVTDEMAAGIGLERVTTKRDRTLALARVRLDVDWIFEQLGGREPKSSIRSVLSVATARGEIGAGWRVRRRRQGGRQALDARCGDSRRGPA